MSTTPLPCTRTSKYHHGRRSGAPSTSFSRWCTPAASIAGPAGAEPAKRAGPVAALLRRRRRGMVSPGHDPHRGRRAREARAHVVEIIGAHEPRLVGEDVEAGIVQAPHRLRFTAIFAGQH